MTEQNTNETVSIKALFAAFGTARPMERSKPKQQSRTVTEAVQIIAANLRRTLEGIETLPEFDKIRKAHLANMPMLNRYQGNLVGKIGYGDNNQEISREMPARMFQSLGQARDFFVAMEQHLLNGRFDALIAAHLMHARTRAQNAAVAAQAKRKELKARYQATKVQEAEEAAQIAKERKAVKTALAQRTMAKAAAEWEQAMKETEEALNAQKRVQETREEADNARSAKSLALVPQHELSTAA